MFDKMIAITDTEAPVVIVDDNVDDTRTAQRCYQRSKLTNPMICFGSGEDFLVYLDQVKDGLQPLPVLVLLDIRMPRMDGFDVLKAIREQESFRAVPVVMMLTNSDYDKDVERSAQLGANGYKEKPSTIADYVAFFDALVPQAGEPQSSTEV
jgi:CheY-like chemotaxis protein